MSQDTFLKVELLKNAALKCEILKNWQDLVKKKSPFNAYLHRKTIRKPAQWNSTHIFSNSVGY